MQPKNTFHLKFNIILTDVINSDRSYDHLNVQSRRFKRFTGATFGDRGGSSSHILPEEDRSASPGLIDSEGDHEESGGDGCAQTIKNHTKQRRSWQIELVWHVGGEGDCGLWSSDVPSAPLCSGPPVEPAVGLTDGRGRLRLAKEALAALHDETSQYAGFDLLQVVRLGADFGLKEVDVGLIPGLLLRTGGGKRTDVQI